MMIHTGHYPNLLRLSSEVLDLFDLEYRRWKKAIYRDV